MVQIRQAVSADVDAAVAALAEAFAHDALMLYLFKDHPRSVRAGIVEFFGQLLRARIALSMPAHVAEQDGVLVGAVMGNRTDRPAWPAPLAAEWDAFEARTPNFSERLAAYEAICDAYQPREAHYYLGVIGVHPSVQGQGAGKAMLQHFCARSSADAASAGVYLDTANPNSLQFYYKNGFTLSGEGELDGAPLWCVYRPG